ncbi:MAG: FHA domain-containing protein, partial [Gammaproteobacteria bacterium]
NNDIVRIAWHTFQFIEDINGELEKTAYTLDS